MMRYSITIIHHHTPTPTNFPYLIKIMPVHCYYFIAQTKAVICSIIIVTRILIIMITIMIIINMLTNWNYFKLLFIISFNPKSHTNPYINVITIFIAAYF